MRFLIPVRKRGYLPSVGIKRRNVLTWVCRHRRAKRPCTAIGDTVLANEVTARNNPDNAVEEPRRNRQLLPELASLNVEHFKTDKTQSC